MKTIFYRWVFPPVDDRMENGEGCLVYLTRAPWYTMCNPHCLVYYTVPVTYVSLSHHWYAQQTHATMPASKTCLSFVKIKLVRWIPMPIQLVICQGSKPRPKADNSVKNRKYKLPFLMISDLRVSSPIIFFSEILRQIHCVVREKLASVGTYGQTDKGKPYTGMPSTMVIPSHYCRGITQLYKSKCWHLLLHIKYIIILYLLTKFIILISWLSIYSVY